MGTRHHTFVQTHRTHTTTSDPQCKPRAPGDDVGSWVGTSVPPGGVLVTRRPCLGAGRVGQLSVSSSQFCCEPRTALEHKILIKRIRERVEMVIFIPCVIWPRPTEEDVSGMWVDVGCLMLRGLTGPRCFAGQWPAPPS